MRRRTMGDAEMKWKDVGTVYVQNEGDVLYIDGFDAERIRVTALVASIEDNRGLRFGVSKDMYVNTFNLAQSTTRELRPLMFELAAIGNYAISTAFAYPNKIIATNATLNLGVFIGMKLEQGENTIKRFHIVSANDKLIVGSWMKVEILE